MDQNDLIDLERQLNMHVQQLTTNFFLSYDFLHLHQSITSCCAILLKKLVCQREMFDLVVSQEQSDPTKWIKSFYWKCSVLDQALDLISDYQGLSMLPLFHCTKRSNNRDSTLCQCLPIPKCLLEVMSNSPIWSYANLMPISLGLSTQTNTRLSTTSAEDALLILSLASCKNLVIQTNSKCSSLMGHVKHLKNGHKKSQLAYYLISKYFLPHRSPLQLRTRRWNLFANQDFVRGNSTSKHLQLATRYLYNIYSHLTRSGYLPSNLLRTYVTELVKISIPRRLNGTQNFCLTSQPADNLWNSFGLPRGMGYEQVLDVTHEPREFLNETSEYRRSILAYFSENAQCLWRSQMNKQKDLGEGGEQCPNLLIKPDEVNFDPNLLGPLYLPAIPVVMTSDG